MRFDGDIDTSYFAKHLKLNTVPSDPTPKAFVVSDAKWDELLERARTEEPAAIDLLNYQIQLDGMPWMPLRAVPNPPQVVSERAKAGWVAILY